MMIEVVLVVVVVVIVGVVVVVGVVPPMSSRGRQRKHNGSIYGRGPPTQAVTQDMLRLIPCIYYYTQFQLKVI